MSNEAQFTIIYDNKTLIFNGTDWSKNKINEMLVKSFTFDSCYQMKRTGFRHKCVDVKIAFETYIGNKQKKYCAKNSWIYYFVWCVQSFS